MNEANNENPIDNLTNAILNGSDDEVLKIIHTLGSHDEPWWVYGYNPLCPVLKKGKFHLAEKLLKLDIIQVNNIYETNKNTPLHWAVFHVKSAYWTTIVEQLLDRGADINQENSLGQNAFDLALRTKNSCVLQVLVDHISDNNIDRKTYLKLLFNLIDGDYVDLAEKLLMKCTHIDIEKSMSDVNFLNLAIEKRQYRTVKSFLGRGINVNFNDTFLSRNRTAIFKACETGDLEIVKLLIDNGANFHIHSRINDYFRETYLPIQMAIIKNHLEIVKELLDQGENVNEIDDIHGKKNSLLNFACEYGHLNIVKLLIDRGADINLRNGCQAPIESAFPIDNSDKDDPKVFEYLLGLENLRLDLESAKFIFFWCAEFTKVYELNLLFRYINRLKSKDYLRYELDTNVLNNGNSKVPLIHKAARHNSDASIDILVKNDIDVNLRNIKGRTALHVAFRYRKFKSLVSLIRNGANIDIECYMRYIPANYTIFRKFRKSRFDSDDDSSFESIDDFEEDHVKDIFNYYRYYVIKMRYLNLFVSDDNYQFATSKMKEPLKYQLKYEKEVELMKKKIIDVDIPYITYYDFIKASLNRRILFLNNSKILEILSLRKNYYSKFPRFADIISNLFHQTLVRKKLLDKVNEYPIFVFLNKNLPYLCVKEIMDYFNNDDLKNVVNKQNFFD